MYFFSAAECDQLTRHYFLKNAYRAHSRRVRRMKEPELDVHYNMRFLEDMKNEFGSGDVVIMRGTERFSRWIQRGTFSHWSHIAMIIVDPDEELRQAYKLSPKFDDETVFVFESDTETLEPRKGKHCNPHCKTSYRCYYYGKDKNEV